MTDRNSATTDHMTPEEAMQFFTIKSSSYYERMNYLGEKAEKGNEGKILNQKQIQRLARLDSWIKKTGKMDGFLEAEKRASEGANLAVAQEASLLDGGAQPQEAQVEQDPLEQELDSLIRAAAKLKAQQIVMPQMVIQELAHRMTFEDLPEDLKNQVRMTQEATNPKSPSRLAEQLLEQWRGRAMAAV